MKKFYISPLVSEVEMSVELGFCTSTGQVSGPSFSKNEIFGEAIEDE